jgi:hypothetical protein
MMAKSRKVITEDFLTKIREKGKLNEALQRLPSDLKQYDRLPLMSTWGLICEEILDTHLEQLFYEKVVAELKKRGIDNDEIEHMRMFAWETAGWLNYEKMAWEWIALDEKDIRKALDLQFSEGEIDEIKLREFLQYLSKYERIGLKLHILRFMKRIELYFRFDLPMYISRIKNRFAR